MTDTPKVSVVIPTYNRAALLKEALASVLAQTEPAWEVIVINNYSEDDTIAVVEGFGDDRIRLVNFRNHGVIGASRNKGIEMARAEWVAFLDSDDTWRPEKLQHCLAAVGEETDIVNHRFVKVLDGNVIWTSPRHRADDATHRNMLFRGNCLAPLTILARRSVLRDANGFSEDKDLITAEDRDLWLKLGQKGARVRFLDTVLADYRMHEEGASRATGIHMDASLRVLEKHFRALDPKKPLDELRYRRQRALVVYAAGRSHQIGGERFAALKFFGKSLLIFPLAPQPYAAALLCCVPGRLEPLPAFLWIWIVAVTVAYLVQFKGFVRPILELLGPI